MPLAEAGHGMRLGGRAAKGEQGPLGSLGAEGGLDTLHPAGLPADPPPEDECGRRSQRTPAGKLSE